MRRVPLSLGVASVVLFSLTAVSCGEQPEDVVLGEVTRADIVEVVDAPAVVVARAATTLTAPAEGTLAELWVSPGDEVREGDVLAVIDSPGAERRLEQAGDALAAASDVVASAGGVGAGDLAGVLRATDEAAADAFEEARAAAGHVADEQVRDALLEQVDAAEERYLEVSAAVADAVGAVEAGLASLGDVVAALGTAQQLQAKQAYDLAAATVEALTLRAPHDGVVQLGGTAGGGNAVTDLLDAAVAGGLTEGLPVPTEVGPPPGVAPGISVGAPVGPGTPVLTVVDVTELELVAEVDETDVLLVEPGITAEVELDAAVGARYPAEVTAVDVLPTPSSRGGVGYGVRLTLGEGSWADGGTAPPPRPGMSAVAHLRVREVTGALAVPAAAVLRHEGTDVVWTVRDGEATRIEVTLGVQGPDLVQVVAGLRPGDRIVVRGADLVTVGQRLS